jgi:hypothetical protein
MNGGYRDRKTAAACAKVAEKVREHLVEAGTELICTAKIRDGDSLNEEEDARLNYDIGISEKFASWLMSYAVYDGNPAKVIEHEHREKQRRKRTKGQRRKRKGVNQ